MLGLLNRILTWWRADRPVAQMPTEAAASAPPRRLQRIRLTDGVSRMLFDNFREHCGTARGDEEIGWILLGLRHEDESIALAALPAGAQRDAGLAHVQFNSDAQALAARILRQRDKRLQIVGVVHTHPGSLRSPSDGDFQGDSLWVSQLRGGEGVFGIGTADGATLPGAADHVQMRDNLCFNWYALGSSDADYRLLPVQTTPGLDLALPLRPVWNVIEAWAEPINRLCRQFAKVELDVIDGNAALCMKIALAEPNQKLRVLFNEAEARYYWERNGELIAIDPHEPSPERAVYLILAELAKDLAAGERRTPALLES